MALQGDGSYYELLEVGVNATFQEIDEAYERISSYLAPGSLALYSMADPDGLSDMRSRLEEAYRTLSDPQRRAAYDSALDPSAEGSSYPTLVVPESQSQSSVTLGRVATDAPAAAQQPAPARLAADPSPQPVSPAEAPAPAPEAPPAPSPPPAHPPAAGPQKSVEKTAPSGAPVPTLRVRAASQRQRRLEPTVELPNLGADTEVSGALLKQLRESADATLSDVADITKISKRYLRALEENDFDALPAPVYVRGFVHEYAKVLGVDADQFARSFMASYRRYRGEGG